MATQGDSANQTAGAPPYKVQLHSAFTKSEQLVPGSTFPAIGPLDQVRVARWLTKDIQSLARQSQQLQERKSQLDQLVKEIRDNEDWLGRPLLPLASTSIITESRRATIKGNGKLGQNRLKLKLSVPTSPSPYAASSSHVQL